LFSSPLHSSAHPPCYTFRIRSSCAAALSAPTSSVLLVPQGPAVPCSATLELSTPGSPDFVRLGVLFRPRTVGSLELGALLTCGLGHRSTYREHCEALGASRNWSFCSSLLALMDRHWFVHCGSCHPLLIRQGIGLLVLRLSLSVSTVQAGRFGRK
jgi:hypothetical protein